MNEQSTTTQTFVDPISGMEVVPTTAAGSFKKEGESYYFCSTGCLQKFIEPVDKKPASCCLGS